MKIEEILTELNFEKEGMILYGSYFIFFRCSLDKNYEEHRFVNILSMGNNKIYKEEIPSGFILTKEWIKNILIKKIKIPAYRLEKIDSKL